MPDIHTLTPLRNIYRENYRRRLLDEPCRFCGAIGYYTHFQEATHNGGTRFGLICENCQQRHPLWHRRVMWLPSIMKVVS
jgi:hypothetical protein